MQWVYVCSERMHMQWVHVCTGCMYAVGACMHWMHVCSGIHKCLERYAVGACMQGPSNLHIFVK